MKLSIVSIGNSKGIRIPKSILKQCNILDQVDIKVDRNVIILKAASPTKEVRSGWGEAFLKGSKPNKDNQMLIDDSIDLDFDGWEWK